MENYERQRFYPSSSGKTVLLSSMFCAAFERYDHGADNCSVHYVDFNKRLDGELG